MTSNALEYELLSNADDWENGVMDPRHEASFFQRLIDLNLIWNWPTRYARRANELMQSGDVHLIPSENEKQALRNRLSPLDPNQ